MRRSRSDFSPSRGSSGISISTRGVAAPGKFQAVSQAAGPREKLSQISRPSDATTSSRTALCTWAWERLDPSWLVIVCDSTIMAMDSSMASRNAA